MTTTQKKPWAYKVVKTQRGTQGEWFRHRTAATFAEQADAEEYARRFATEQRGVAGTRILVLARKGGRVVADIRVDDSRD